MYFVYQEGHGQHGNGKEPDWLMIDFLYKGVRTGWALGTGHNDQLWGKDIYQQIKANPEEYLIVEAVDYKQLMQTKEYKEKWDEYVRSAIDPNSKLGWISPDGQFIGCSYRDHAFVAREYIGKDELQLEDAGWCKVYALTDRGIPKDDINYYAKNFHFTEAQKETVRRHNEKFPSHEARFAYVD